MADNKEALPVVAWRTDDHGTSSVALEWEDLGLIGQRHGYPLTDHTTATAALSELRAEVERYRHVCNAIEALHQAQTINNQNYSNRWHEAIYAARAGASGGTE